MARWTKNELHKVAEADDLHISPFGGDDATLDGRLRLDGNQTFFRWN